MNEWQKQFKQWYDSNYGSKRKVDFTNDSGIARSTWPPYLGEKDVSLEKLSPETRGKLYRITGLECFRLKTEDSACEISDVVDNCVSLFYSLADNIEQVKDSHELRESLVSKLPKSDVGRLTSLLHAVYKSRDDFDQWMLFSGYSYVGGKNGKR